MRSLGHWRKYAIGMLASLAATVVVALVAQLLVTPEAGAQQRLLPPPASGNVNCDSSVDVIDALFILQLEIGIRTPVAACPLPEPASNILAGAGDVNGDGAINVVDSLLIAQCEVGVPNLSCPASSINGLEVEWAAARQAIIDEIIANEWGRRDTVVVGPGNMFINLTPCPSDWDDMAGIEGGVVTIGHTTATSGALGSYGDIGLGMGMYFDHVNERGGIGPLGLEINLETRDDAFVPTQTIDRVEALLANDDPFSVVNFGTAPTLAVRERLNEACVPQPLAISGHSGLGDAARYPFTTGGQISYVAEAKLWVEWIDQNLAPGTHVGLLVMDNDFGYEYESAFERFVVDSPTVESVIFVRHDPAAQSLVNEMTTLAESNLDVVILMTAGNPCLLALGAAGDLGLSSVLEAAFLPSVCTGVSAYLAPAGDAAQGWLALAGGVRTPSNPDDADDPFVSWVRSELSERGGDPDSSLFSSGFGFHAWTHVEALRIAAELPGGLTRSNFLVALRAIELNHPMLVPGIALSMNGKDDPHLIEGSDVNRFDVASQSWIREGVIDANGQVPACSWNPATGCQD